MSECRDDLTNEEYFSYLDVAPAQGYPKKLTYGNKIYLLIVKNFTYTGKITKKERQLLSAEIWDEAMESKKIGIILVKSDNCRFHSPSNPNFNMVPELFGTEEGKFYMTKIIEALSEIGFSFLIEEVFGEDVGYNHLSKTYDKEKYAKIRDFFISCGFTFTFNKAKGRGQVILKAEKLTEHEKKCFSQIKKELSKAKPALPGTTLPPLSG